jgi:hypothetical protein
MTVAVVGELREQLKEREETGNRPGPKKVVDEKAWAVRPSPNQLSGTVLSEHLNHLAKK